MGLELNSIGFYSGSQTSNMMQESLPANELPSELLQLIFEKLKNFPLVSQINKLWYENYQNIFVKQQQVEKEEIQTAIQLIISTVEDLNSEQSKEAVIRLKRIITDYTASNDYQTSIYAFEKGKFELKKDITFTLHFFLTSEEISALHSLTYGKRLADENYIKNPLTKQLLCSAYYEYLITTHSWRDFYNNLMHIIYYAQVINDEEKIREFRGFFQISSNIYFDSILEYLLSYTDVKSNKTAIRLMSKLKPEGYSFNAKYRWESIKQSIICLLRNNEFNSIVKLAEVFEKSIIKEIYTPFIPLLLEGRMYDVAKEALKGLNRESYRAENEFLEDLLKYCVTYLLLGGQIDEGFEIINEKPFSLQTYFIGEFSIDHMPKMPVQYLVNIRMKMQNTPNLFYSDSVKVFLSNLDKRIYEISLDKSPKCQEFQILDQSETQKC